MSDIETADLSWRDGDMPESNRFGDIYFNPTDGLSETRYVFLEGIGAPDCWKESRDFVIGETGFGTGLNFLASWQAWEKSAKPGCRLHYISVEGFPLTREELKKALSAWPELAEQARELVAQYPSLHPGFHRLILAGGRVYLTLLFGEVTHMLDQVTGRVDAWFLDGFAPSKNPDMWRLEVYQQLARLSASDARLATFTAAGHVRRGLADAGFDMQKAPGFGHKRECLRGLFKGGSNQWNGRPWYAPPAPLAQGSQIAVIGGGVAGISLARGLRAAGFKPVVFEAAKRLAAVGSGNYTGLIQPRLTAADSLEGRFNAASFLFAARHYDRIHEAQEVWHPNRGVMQLARRPEDLDRFNRLIQEARLPADQMSLLEASVASEIAGIRINHPALYFPKAGALHPRNLVPLLAEGLEIRLRTAVANISFTDDMWRLMDADGNCLDRVDAVVLATGALSTNLCPLPDFPINANRGQVVHLKATETSAKLQVGLSAGGYICPPAVIDSELAHVSGASYSNITGETEADFWRQLDGDDEAENLGRLEEISPDLARLRILPGNPGRAGLRATVSDHMPVAGGLPDPDWCEENYADLHHGKAARHYAPVHYQPGLYCLTGLASRGLQSAPYLTEALVDLMLGVPNLLTRDHLEAIHMGRFQVRRLQRRKQRASSGPG